MKTCVIPKARVVLNGNFELTSSCGRVIQIKEKKGRALMAMLATEPNMRRSRAWLKARIWSRTTEPQCSYSLRQSLYKLRMLLGPDLNILCSNREFVWLDRTIETVNSGTQVGAEFFEDAPHLDEPFEDWLRLERQARRWKHAQLHVNGQLHTPTVMPQNLSALTG